MGVGSARVTGLVPRPWRLPAWRCSGLVGWDWPGGVDGLEEEFHAVGVFVGGDAVFPDEESAEDGLWVPNTRLGMLSRRDALGERSGWDAGRIGAWPVSTVLSAS